MIYIIKKVPLTTTTNTLRHGDILCKLSSLISNYIT